MKFLIPHINRYNDHVINSYVDDIKNSVYKLVSPVSVEAWITDEPVGFAEKQTGEYRRLEIGDKWGDLFTCAWMHVQGRVPEQCKGKKVVLRFDVSGEGCVYNSDGYPIRGITTYATRIPEFGRPFTVPVKRIIDISECSDGSEKFDFWIDCGCNDLLGKLIDGGTLKNAEICTCDEEIRQFFYDYKFLLLLSETLGADTTRRKQIQYTLYDVALNTDISDSGSVAEARSKLAVHLGMPNSDLSLKVSALGHAHIDLAWLWPIRETKRKGLRTFTTALRMMEKYPDYIFGASQPQLYEWVRESQPGVFEEIKKRVDEGRWECQGAMWVEPDTNIPSGESLVRQIVYGKKYFLENFGQDMKTLWLPDVFGYSAALPQILKKSEVPYFMTIKLSWNEHNVFPHNTFVWKGLDGSEVLAHMPPENTYNGDATPRSLTDIQKDFKNKDVSDEALMLFGVGDGGGGPSTDHLEYLKREKSVAGLPPVTQKTSTEFFESIDKNRSRYPIWCGELYLEKHQGTYTSQANSKKYNRLLELALRDCEFVSSVAYILNKNKFTYPAEELKRIWKEVLLYQFHDILPGSSIKRVYDESVDRYKKLYSRVRELTCSASEALADIMNVGDGQKLAVNTIGFERDEECAVPAYGYSIVDDMPGKPEFSDDSYGQVLENEYLRVEISDDGSIGSMFDKQHNRELINKKFVTPSNLVIYDDRGDCWDMEMNYLDRLPQQPKVTGIKSSKNSVTIDYKYNNSSLTQIITLPEHSKKLVFKVKADWQETFKMLRGNYPIDIHTQDAACEIQFGHVHRPTHLNTTWDTAKIEICAHKWVDFSETGYGVAIINDCKYGYNVWNNSFNINLLRSQMYPGENADKGKHEFSYELFVHDGDLLKVIEESYKFNISLLTAEGKGEKTGLSCGSFFEISEPNVLIETVKLAEDASGVILRLYESTGKRSQTKIKLPSDFAAELVTMTEKTINPLEVKEGSIDLLFKPFEIHTVKIKC